MFTKYNRTLEDIIPELRCVSVDCTRIETSTKRIARSGENLLPPQNTPGFRNTVHDVKASQWFGGTPLPSVQASQQVDRTTLPRDQSFDSLASWTYKAAHDIRGSVGIDSGRSKVMVKDQR